MAMMQSRMNMTTAITPTSRKEKKSNEEGQKNNNT